MPAASGKAVLRYVGANVRRLRTRAGLTQAVIAEAAGVDLTYLQRVERGSTNITVLVLVALAAALDVRPARLLRPADPVPRPSGRPKSRRSSSRAA